MTEALDLDLATPAPRVRAIVARARRHERAGLLREAADVLQAAADAIHEQAGAVDADELGEATHLHREAARYARLAQAVNATADDLDADGGVL